MLASFLERLKRAAGEIAEAQRPVRILRAVAWPDRVKEEFFAGGGRELPRPEYEPPRFDVAATAGRLREIAAWFPGEGDLDRLVRETCLSYATAAEMLGAVGTRRFSELSRELYGAPLSVSSDGKTTNLALAEHFDAVIARYQATSLGPEEAELDAEAVAAALGERFARFFHAHEVRVEVVEQLGANAVAGGTWVRVKRGARFSTRDAAQLEHHEGYVHIATSLNGRAQPVLRFLGSGAPRTTRTQEGLAVLGELLSQTMDLERLRRLSDRILAIKLAEDGADFLELYRYFLEHGHEPEAAFDCARRVCRGGLVEGGAPFTKDVCYLDGLVRVSNFLRVALTHGRADFVEVLFAGKLDLGDIPILAELRREGALAPPVYLPPWARDLRFLTAYMSYSAFLNQTDLAATRAHVEELIRRAEAAF
jgi:uncharacterized protein (TIGR02421 family)